MGTERKATQLRFSNPQKMHHSLWPGPRRPRTRQASQTPSMRRCWSVGGVQVLFQEVHQEGVVVGAGGGAFVLAHDADGAEADALVGADGALVVGGGVDGEAVVAAVVEQVAG